MNGTICSIVSLAVIAILQSGGARADDAVDQPRPLPKAHAHNDYEHPRPLLDALSHGFCSVEADIHLVDGHLLVAHDPEDVRSDRRLEGLYLDPLQTRIRANGGRVYRDGPPFTLLIDIKTQGESTYRALHRVLEEYRDVLTNFHADGRVEEKGVTVVISGNRPWEVVAAQSVRYAGVDGRIGDLESDKPPHLMPLVSDNWRNHFTWRGQGTPPDSERERLRDWVRRAHARGYGIRFWATPETVDAWRELHAAGVDLINTDDLAGLQQFLARTAKPDTKE